jgi:hypothetical protein
MFKFLQWYGPEKINGRLQFSKRMCCGLLHLKIQHGGPCLHTQSWEGMRSTGRNVAVGVVMCLKCRPWKLRWWVNKFHFQDSSTATSLSYLPYWFYYNFFFLWIKLKYYIKYMCVWIRRLTTALLFEDCIQIGKM